MDAMNKIKILLLMIVCFATGVAMAQQRRISGTVSDDFGGIMMANVAEIDANNRIVSATTTDMNGNFTMTIKNPKNKLRVTYMGFQNHVEVIGNKSVFKVKMKDASRTLENVTITHKKKTMSGGLSIPERELGSARQKFNMDEMKGLSFESVDEALQGKIAGLDIVANSGNLGSGTTMRLRGTTTFNGNAEPLIVVDGHIFEMPDNAQSFDFENLDNEEQFSTLLQVNPEDIAEIEVLKDASATAIWGAKGANGVLSIKTRRGSRGKTRVNFSYRFSGNWQGKGMNMLDGDGYTMMLKEAYFNPKQETTASNMLEVDYNPAYPYIYNNYNKNTDWVDAVTQLGQAHNYYVTLTGGGEKATFRIGVGYDKETGTIIKQNLDRFTSRLALDYYVSDRIKFSSNFSLSFTDNHKNHKGPEDRDILARAYMAMPNMSIYEYVGDAENPRRSGNYFNMLPTTTVKGYQPNNTSANLSDMYSNRNPVAVANLAWRREQQFNITPQFSVEYKFLGKDDDQTQLNYTGDVQLQVYNTSENSYFPATLTNNTWSQGINLADNREYKSLQMTTRHDLAFYPKFNNEDHSVSALARFELTTGTSNDQSLSSRGIPSGLTDPTLDAFLTACSTSPGEWRSLSYVGQVHYSYKSKYSVNLSARVDGRTDFGAGKKYGVFPGVNGRWNIIDENFMKPTRNWLSMLAVRPGWGIVGNVVGGGNQYNRYADMGSYGNGHGAIGPENLRLASLQWEKTSSWNIGFDLGLWDDLITMALEVYNKKTTELAMSGVKIPSHTGFSSLDWQNVGIMRNQGWELYVNTGKFARVGKFSMKLSANIAQNINEIEEMDASVLESMNSDYSYENEEYLTRVQVGNALGSIYGFRFKGIYAYDYDHNGYTASSIKNYASGEMDPDRPGYFKNGEKVPTAAAAALRGDNATCPIAYDANGNMITDAKGNPLPMYFNYGGTKEYQFQGGDVIYEDINKDGQINALDIVYLGNSNPKCNGGFGIDLYYGNWSLSASFNYRIGNQIVNMARMQAEDMLNNNNQSKATSWRWRKNGDDTEIPRAMNSNAADRKTYNALASDRYVEDGDYLRFQYLRMGYNFDAKKIKKFGLTSLSLSASANNLWVWSKYTGTDPDVSAGKWGMAMDNNRTPRSKSFTVSLNVGF